MIRTKRVYEPAAESDGSRFLIDRLWPRGVKKQVLQLAGWLKDLAPSDELRKWFGHDPDKWAEFRRRYAGELREKPEALRPLLDAAKHGEVTLLFGAKDREHNNAVGLKDILEQKLRRGHA